VIGSVSSRRLLSFIYMHEVTAPLSIAFRSGLALLNNPADIESDENLNLSAAKDIADVVLK
jgi:hypothetical protein